MEQKFRSVLMARSMFDVFSISIHASKTKGCPNPLSDRKLCHIYGIVKVHDDDESVYHIYNRTDGDPDVISLGGKISLTGFPVIPSKVLTVSVYLYDMAHQAEISNDTFILDYTCEYPYDKLQISKVEGQHGFAYVHHATFLHAVVADVKQVSITKEDGGSSHLYGSVVASLVGACGDEYGSAVLFNNAHKDEDEDEESKCVVAKFNTPIQLYRSCVAVPVFCTLSFRIDFRDENDITISRTISRHIDSRGVYEVSAIEGNWKAIVELFWPFCNDELPRERGVIDQVNAKQVFKQDLKAINFSLPSEPQEVFSRYSTKFAKSSYISYGEVFSVLIRFNEDVLDIEGTITLNDSSGEPLHIFRGSDKLSTERKTLAIQCPRLFEIKDDETFHIVLSLKDGKGRVVGQGICKWRERTMDSFFDRHLCTVFRGDIAYTVVHFSLLTRCVQARVVVSFIRNGTQVPETQVRVCGSITAEYGNYEYSTLYDQQNFKYKLFSRSQDECTQLDLGSTLELSKSLLPVPFQETLILDVDLKVGQGVDRKFEALKQVVEFEHCKSNVFALDKGNYTFFVSVEWSNDNDPKSFTYPNISDMRSLRKVMPNIPLKV